MEEGKLVGGSGTGYEVTIEELPLEKLAADEVYHLRISVAEKAGEHYVFSVEASYDTEALYFSRRIHSEKSEDQLKQEWKAELAEWTTHMVRHYF